MSSNNGLMGISGLQRALSLSSIAALCPETSPVENDAALILGRIFPLKCLVAVGQLGMLREII